MDTNQARRIPAGDLAQKVAEALTYADRPHIWLPRFSENGEHGAYVETDDCALWLSTTWQHAGKLHIAGHYPTSEDRQVNERSAWPYSETRPAINVSPQRSPASIAADIARRLLRDVRDLTARTKIAIAQHEEARSAQEMAAQALEKAGARRWSKQNDETRLTAETLELKVSYDGTRVDIMQHSSLPLEMAVELVAKLARAGSSG